MEILNSRSSKKEISLIQIQTKNCRRLEFKYIKFCKENMALTDTLQSNLSIEDMLYNGHLVTADIF